MTDKDKLKELQLRQAIRQGDLPKCRALIAAGADFTATDENGWTPLHLAALEETPEITGLLLEAGASTSARCGKGNWTALHIAVSYGHAETTKELLVHSADIEAKADKDWTPLHIAAWAGHAQTLSILLGCGADTGAQTTSSKTAAELAEGKGYAETTLEISKAVSLRHALQMKALKKLMANRKKKN
ncbi:ankyrin repeat domain-containing protein [Sneathiella sp. HT1-7]|uniref:ankyrin repeat domain-containing protein n=1 Tax=Sneathiella sp. HT1-7 TaxID=2887192 RepID=UPI001D139D16|nr:ankyrin repeat domain-containing protein [Sneathiella sp. HT1-7]MCC3305104.1 ankyrin repeat domain-containing protein [Sneathiella sp. HT1-7]